MKSLIIATTILLAAFSSKAANPSLSQLLSLYYDVKNALVNSDPGTTGAKAAEFVKVLNSVDLSTLSADEHKAFMPLQQKLAADADAIATSTDLSQQREKFKTFSSNIHTLVKAVKLSADPVYQLYCPMQKSYWLSSEAAVKNPYYGKKMLTCGNVTGTIN